MTIEERAEYEELAAIVKAGSFMSLSTKEKRERYSELKKIHDADNSLMTISKAELEKMVQSAVEKYKETAESLQDRPMRFGEWRKTEEQKVGNNVAKLRVFREDATKDGGIVIDLKYKKMVFNEETRRYDIPMYVITVLYDNDGRIQYDVPLTEFIKINEFEEVEIIEKKEEILEKDTGVGQRSYSNNGYYYSAPGFFGTKNQPNTETFKMQEFKKDVVCVCKRPNGKLITLNASKLNA